MSIKIENWDIQGFEPAIRGMRNPKNSWDRSDTLFFDDTGDFYTINGDTGPYDYPRLTDRDLLLGVNDHELMMRLANGGPVHAKYRRMIVVWVDITAPFYWLKEADTYRVGVVCNSSSTMHKIHAKEFTLDDFSYEHTTARSIRRLRDVIEDLNFYRDIYLNGGIDGSKEYAPKDKEAWWQMIQLLPTSYNQRRTYMLNYEVLAGIYPMRKNHKLDEWVEFCRWAKDELPYSEIFTGEQK